MSEKLSDYEQRLKLAKSIGLDKVPEIDDNAFEKLNGLLDKELHEKEEREVK